MSHARSSAIVAEDNRYEFVDVEIIANGISKAVNRTVLLFTNEITLERLTLTELTARWLNLAEVCSGSPGGNFIVKR